MLLSKNFYRSNNILNQPLTGLQLLKNKVIQLPAQDLLVNCDGIEPLGDSLRCIPTDVVAGVSQKVRIAQVLEVGFQLSVFPYSPAPPVRSGSG